MKSHTNHVQGRIEELDGCEYREDFGNSEHSPLLELIAGICRQRNEGAQGRTAI